MSKEPFNFNMVCFTTNSEKFRPLSIINKYLTNSDCGDDIKLNKKNSIKFYYELENKQFKHKKILILINEILNLEEEKYDICNFCDSYLIIIDLESDDTYEQLETILNFMRNICDLEKSIFILGVYFDPKNTKKELDEENIIDYLDGQKLIYEYVESNVDSIKDLVKTVDFIIKEGIKKIEKKIVEMELKEQTENQCKSICSIY